MHNIKTLALTAISLFTLNMSLSAQEYTSTYEFILRDSVTQVSDDNATEKSKKAKKPKLTKSEREAAKESKQEQERQYREWVNNDRLVARYCAERGFRYKDETQRFGDRMIVYGTGLFGHAFCVNPNFSVSYHHNAATWESERWTRTQRISFLFDKIGLLPVYKGYKRFKKRIKRLLKGQ